MKNKITKQKLDKYFDVTNRALAQAKKNISKEKQTEAKEIIEMTENYFSDAEYFKKNNDWVNALAALAYAHGWLDTGARLKIFNVTDDKLFTLPQSTLRPKIF